VAIDVSRESYDQIGSPVVEKAGMAHKIDFRVGFALPVLDQLVAEVRFSLCLHVAAAAVTS
jgi:caffeoyl-CoA O-methyltransferase